jgi:hypothetical protein
MEHDVDAPDVVDLDCNVAMEKESEDEEDEEEEDEKEKEVVDEAEEEDEDNGKEPLTIGQGEMVNTSADDAYTMVDDKPTVQPGQGQEARKHTHPPHPLVCAPRPQTPEPPPTPTNSANSYLQWAGVLGDCDAVKTSPSGPNSVKS